MKLKGRVHRIDEQTYYKNDDKKKKKKFGKKYLKSEKQIWKILVKMNIELWKENEEDGWTFIE